MLCTRQLSASLLAAEHPLGEVEALFQLCDSAFVLLRTAFLPLFKVRDALFERLGRP